MADSEFEIDEQDFDYKSKTQLKKESEADVRRALGNWQGFDISINSMIVLLFDFKNREKYGDHYFEHTNSEEMIKNLESIDRTRGMYNF